LFLTLQVNANNGPGDETKAAMTPMMERVTQVITEDVEVLHIISAHSSLPLSHTAPSSSCQGPLALEAASEEPEALV